MSHLGFDAAADYRVFPSLLSKMHEKGGNFCSFLLKIAEKEEKPTPMALVRGTDRAHLIAAQCEIEDILAQQQTSAKTSQNTVQYQSKVGLK